MAPRGAGKARRRHVCSMLLVAVVLVVALGAPAVSRAAGWSRPFRLDGPLSGDVTSPQLAVSASGQAAVTFALTDEDHPWASQAMLVLRSAGGRLSRLTVRGAKQVLDAAFAGKSLELLTGSGAAAQTCCGAVQAVEVQGTAFASRQTILTKLTGATVGRLVTLPGRGLLAALATDRTVWAGQSRPGRRMRPMRRLSGRSSWPQALDAIGLPRGRDAVVWSGAPGLTESASNVLIAIGTVKRPPRGPRVAVNVAAGHAVDGIAVAPNRGAATVAWIESWFDSTGAYQSQVVVVDVTSTLRPRTFQFPGEIASGLSLGADAAGEQVLVVRTCDQLGSCRVLALARSARGQFGAPQALGTIDASQEPVAAVSARGAAAIGWVDRGLVVASGRRSALARFAAARVVPGPGDAANLALAFGTGGQALAAWVQGTLAPSVMGALFAP